jgi:transcriptional regulator with XRE-family HTH domain
MNQVLLARTLGLDQSTISRWQSGERAVSLYWATRIAEVLSCSLDDLLHLPAVCQAGILEDTAAELVSEERPGPLPQLAEEGAG